MRWLFVGGCGVALLVSAAWFFGIGTYRMMTFPRPFSSKLWKEAAEGAVDGTNIDRCLMVLDLRTRVGLVGKNRSEVIDLLGDEHESSSGLPELYMLCPSMGDYYVLDLEWKDGIVTDTRVHDT